MSDTHPAQLPALPPMEFNYIGTLTPPPATGQVRLDNATQSAATKMWVSKTSATSDDATATLAAIVKDMEITLANKSDGTKWQTYVVTGSQIVSTSYVEIPVRWSKGGAVIPAQRTLLTPATVAKPVSVPVTGLRAAASVGGVSVTTTHGINIGVNAPAMTASVGSVAVTADRNVVVDIQPLPIMRARPGTVTVIGQSISYDYVYPFEGAHISSPGMTIRQYYAAAALQGFISRGIAHNLIGTVAPYCFRVADSMIAYDKLEHEEDQKRAGEAA